MEDIPLSVLILLQIIIIAVNAFLSVMDTSMQSLSDGRIKRSAEDGDKKAISMLHIKDLELKLSGAIAFAVVFVNTVSGVFVAYPLSQIIADSVLTFDTHGIEWALSNIILTLVIVWISTSVSILFGHLITKRIALAKNPGQTLKPGQRFAMTLYNILKPTIFPLTKLSEKISGKFIVPDKSTDADAKEDEILMVVDAVKESGAIESDEQEMIENVFNFASTAVSTVMTHRTNVISIWINDTNEDILKTISESGRSRFPVYDEDIDHIVGILIARDYLLNLASESPKPFAEILRPAYLVPETILTNELFKDMQLKNNHMAIVVDEYGGTSGVVTMEDLLEEIVGNIYDESDIPEAQKSIEKLEENVWRVAGDTELTVLSEELMITLPEDEAYETVGGLVFNCLPSIPQDGENPEVVTNGMYIYVEELKNRRIMSAKISLIIGVDPPPEISSDTDEDD